MLGFRIAQLIKLSAEDAIIPEEKLRDYLLSRTHPDGCGKAQYLAHLGYRQYDILGPLTGPNGVTGWVRTIWIGLHGEKDPRLVTLIPEEGP